MIKRLLTAALVALASIPAALGAQATYSTPTTGPMSFGTFVSTYLNPALAAVLSNNSGSSAPSVSGQPGAYQWWVDTSGSPKLLKLYDGASWLTLASIDASGHVLTINSSALSGLGSGVLTWLQTASSANLRGALTDETGTGLDYFQGGDLGTPSAGVGTNLTGIPIATGITGSSANLRTALSDETGTGLDYFQGGDLGTPSAGVGTNLTGIPIATGITGSSANLRTALSDETGTGLDYFQGGDAGTPSAITLTNGTALPVAGITGSTSTPLGVGSIELGNASDTSLTRVSAGVAAIEGSSILTAATGQPLDSDLTTIAGLTATTDNFMQAKSSAWTTRTPTQVTADLIPCVGDGGSGGSKGLVPAPVSGDASKFLRGDCTFVAIPGGGDALVANPLSQFASTTSAQFAGVISNETGSGKVVFDTSPLLTTPDIGNTDTTLDRVSAGVISVEGTPLYSNIPQNSQSGAYTLVLADAQKQIFHPSADTTARTWTIPANASVAFPIGTAITFINQNAAGQITIAITSDTMRLAGSGATGNRTLASNGVATAIKVTSTEWIISGTGLT